MARKKHRRKKRIGARKHHRRKHRRMGELVNVTHSARRVGRKRRHKRIGAKKHHKWGSVSAHRRRVAKSRRRKHHRIGATSTGGQFMSAHHQLVGHCK